MSESSTAETRAWDRANVLVRGNEVEKISKDPIAIDRSPSTKIINCGGRTLMPGLIDAQAHMTMSILPLAL